MISTIICFLPVSNLLFENKEETQFPNTNIFCLVKQKQGGRIIILINLYFRVRLCSNGRMCAGREASILK